ncbi:hypothetical protein BS1321_25360 [Peribacillus simplex NBRC 15720 = DSM 1321]|uniref:Uncharacterized protein n=1 Tax=Peribacillus simplex NBRC 15720 = DSM 1321 TaxID=1349754 RepID=A0A223ENY2_9BACI|nr:hypothetical protein BS1321_25360 [Peribacillus simplex NBRC 15720 = DSM 1321]
MPKTSRVPNYFRPVHRIPLTQANRQFRPQSLQAWSVSEIIPYKIHLAIDFTKPRRKDIIMLQQILHHSRPSVTLRYIGITE